MDTKNGKRKILRLSALLFLAFLIIVTVANLIKRDKDYSEDENRMLAQKPKLTLSNIASGRYMEQYESYQSDQFAGRNLWVSLKTRADKISGKKEENGVFQGKSNFLLEDIKKPEADSMKANLDAMKQFQKAYPDLKMNMMLVPNAANILSEKLPAFAVTADQDKLMKDVRKNLSDGFGWIDTGKVLSGSSKEGMYYHTDHHWTSDGAYKAFLASAKTLGIDKEKLVPMKKYAVTDSFNGTLSSTSGFERGYEEPIYMYLPNGKDPGVVVNYVEEQKKSATMYDTKKLEEKDKYAVFLGGNYPQVSIRTMSESNERILIFKDSYANCFVPFLTPYYREIVMIDPRYFYGDIKDVVDSGKFSQVLFLYNANTFFEDNSISGVLGSGE